MRHIAHSTTTATATPVSNGVYYSRAASGHVSKSRHFHVRANEWMPGRHRAVLPRERCTRRRCHPASERRDLGTTGPQKGHKAWPAHNQSVTPHRGPRPVEDGIARCFAEYMRVDALMAIAQANTRRRTRAGTALRTDSCECVRFVDAYTIFGRVARLSLAMTETRGGERT